VEGRQVWLLASLARLLITGFLQVDIVLCLCLHTLELIEEKGHEQVGA
jgi:hypothetical protein